MTTVLANKPLLLNSWRRILTSRHISYRHLQRREIEAFATSTTALLSEIYKQIHSQTYMPTGPDKVGFPKDKFSTRTLTLLTLPDWVVYTAIGTLVAENMYAKEKSRYNSTVFSNLPRIAKRRPNGFFQRWERQYNLYNRASESASSKYPFLLDFDLTAFYDLVDHELLITRVRTYIKDVYMLELLGRMLRTWTGDTLRGSFAHGLPQGPEASGLFADLFLFAIDDIFFDSPNHVYLRYVDDIRVFAQSRRECEVAALKLEKTVKQIGLVPNSTKTKIIDTRKAYGWLKQPDYGEFSDPSHRKKLNRRSLFVRIEHDVAKKIFLQHARRSSGSPKNELRVRRTFIRMLPDKDVIKRVTQIYPIRTDLWELMFQYLFECSNDKEVHRFSWRRLRILPTRDWECSNLIEVLIRTNGLQNISSRNEMLLEQYFARKDLPLTQANAASALITFCKRIPTATWLNLAPATAVAVANWLPSVLRTRFGKPIRKRSVLAIVKRLIAQQNPKTSFLVAFLAGAKLSKSDSVKLPPPNSTYGRIVFNEVSRLGQSPLVDEIALQLKVLFALNIPQGFDFHTKLASLDRRLYDRALMHLQWASWYFDTSPTYFVNHIHNFNHVLWFFSLKKHNLTSGNLQWKNAWGNLTNQTVKTKFPTMAVVFDKCRIARNTNLSTHPMDEKRKRFTKSVTYPERDYLRSQLKAAYREFMTTA